MDVKVKNLWIERAFLEKQYFAGIKKIFQKVFRKQIEDDWADRDSDSLLAKKEE